MPMGSLMPSRRPKSFRKLTIAAIVAVSLLVAACQPAATTVPPTRPASATKADTTPAPGAVSPTPVAAKEEPRRGGVLRYWTRATLPGFDIIRLKTTLVSVVTSQVFNSLVRFDPTREETQAENIVPDLAERWEMSKDGLHYTFYLRKGVLWHDGKPFAADDVKYSTEKIMDPKRSATSAWFPGFGSVDAVDDHAVRINLREAQASFLSMLATGYANMLPRHTADVDSRSMAFLVGTGPFKAKRQIPGASFELERNNQYHVPGLPYLDGIQVYIVSDPAAQVAAFLTRRVQMNSPWGGGIIDSQTLQQIRSRAPDAKVAMKTAPITWSLWGPLHRKGHAWQDKRVRQAFNLVWDREQMLLAAFGDVNFSTYGGFLYAGSPYALPRSEFLKLAGLDKPYEARVAEAKRLMTAAGYPDGNGYPEGEVVMRQGQSQRERYLTTGVDLLRRNLGVNLNIKLVDLALLRDKQDQADFEYLFEILSSIIGDPDEMLAGVKTGSNLNYAKYSNPQVDELIRKQSASLDVAERIRLTQEAERLVVQDWPYLPSAYLPIGSAYYPEVRGFVLPSNTATHVNLDHVWLASGSR